MKRASRIALPTLFSTLALLVPSIAAAAPVTWTEWTSATAGVAGVATGTITTGGSTVTVNYSGQATFIQVNNTGTNYFIPTAPYTSAQVDNAPARKDIIALSQAGARTLTFSEPVKNLFFAVVSLNGNSYVFNRDFEVVSNGVGFWGGGTLSRVDNGNGTYTVSGTGEPHGVIKFLGSVTSISWTAGAENWNGFTVGTYGLGDEDDDSVFDKNEYGPGGIGTPRDSDGDLTPDYKDSDDDGDGIPTSVEAPLGVARDTDGDGVPDYRDGDSDNDGIPDAVEAGATPATPVDSDGDGIADFRDGDSDNDGILDLWENGGKGLDANGDGKIDDLTDVDGDGVLAGVDKNDASSAETSAKNPLVNSDADLIPNYLDADSDGDGVNDVLEVGLVDANNDGKVDAFADVNLNGIHDPADVSNGGTAIAVTDSDADGKGDYVDVDSDNDCVLDSSGTESGAARTNKALPNASVDLNCGVLGSGNVCDTSTGACVSGCKVDADCASGQFCSPGGGVTVGSCKAKGVNGASVPADAPASGVCALATVASACVSGACEMSDNKCGLLNGSACTSTSQCRSATCTSNLCGGVVVSDGGTDGGAVTSDGGVVVTDGGVAVSDGGSVVSDSGSADGAATATDSGKADSGAGTLPTIPEPDTLEGGGCSCNSTSSPVGSLVSFVLGALGFAVARRRRRVN